MFGGEGKNRFTDYHFRCLSSSHANWCSGDDCEKSPVVCHCLVISFPGFSRVVTEATNGVLNPICLSSDLTPISDADPFFMTETFLFSRFNVDATLALAGWCDSAEPHLLRHLPCVVCSLVIGYVSSPAGYFSVGSLTQEGTFYNDYNNDVWILAPERVDASDRVMRALTDASSMFCGAQGVLYDQVYPDWHHIRRGLQKKRCLSCAFEMYDLCYCMTTKDFYSFYRLKGRERNWEIDDSTLRIRVKGLLPVAGHSMHLTTFVSALSPPDLLLLRKYLRPWGGTLYYGDDDNQIFPTTMERLISVVGRAGSSMYRKRDSRSRISQSAQYVTYDAGIFTKDPRSKTFRCGSTKTASCGGARKGRIILNIDDMKLAWKSFSLRPTNVRILIPRGSVITDYYSLLLIQTADVTPFLTARGVA